MNKIKYVILSVILLFPVILSADQPFQAPGFNWQESEKIYACLNLSKDQADKIRTLRTEYEKAVRPLKIREFEMNSELRLLWMQIKTDADKIRGKQKNLNELNWQIQEKTLDYWFGFRGLLTPKQLNFFLAVSSGHNFGPPWNQRLVSPAHNYRKKK